MCYLKGGTTDLTVRLWRLDHIERRKLSLQIKTEPTHRVITPAVTTSSHSNSFNPRPLN